MSELNSIFNMCEGGSQIAIKQEANPQVECINIKTEFVDVAELVEEPANIQPQIPQHFEIKSEPVDEENCDLNAMKQEDSDQASSSTDSPSTKRAKTSTEGTSSLMKLRPNDILEFKIVLRDIHPQIWRTVQFSSNCSFFELHMLIQRAMGWRLCHNHQFEALNLTTNNVDTIMNKLNIDLHVECDTFEDTVLRDELTTNVGEYLGRNGARILYTYDMGDSWEHEVTFIGIVPRRKTARYPRCLAGARACPPEDCGGYPGYEYLLEIIRDPQHEEYEHYLSWLEGSYPNFDPDHFDPKAIVF